ncbi:MAG: putative two-component system response regulator [Pirellulaceae bacterium]|jgi:putative two-component system response regulator
MIQRVLLVDTDAQALAQYEDWLREYRDQWDVCAELDPSGALRRVQNEFFDAIVVSVHMAGMSGIDLLEALQSSSATADVPVIMVVEQSEPSLKQAVLELGAIEVLAAPVCPQELIARISSALRLRECQQELRHHKLNLEEQVQQRTRQLELMKLDIIFRLGKAAEYRDEETGNHVLRVGCFARTISEEMGMPESFCSTIFLAAPLHDIGKIGIPDAVLLKNGPLNDVEWEVMRQHCKIGSSILSDDGKMFEIWQQWSGRDNVAGERLGNPITEMAATIAASHHEKWNGSGYPLGLAGEQIPIESRIVAICDVFDALRSERPYKEGFSLEKTLRILKESEGTHFDPAVYKAFMATQDRLLEIERGLSDRDAERPPLEQHYAMIRQ